MSKKKPKTIIVSPIELDKYSKHIHSDDNPKKSLVEFIQELHGEEPLKVSLVGFNFAKYPSDLSGADLSGVILDGIVFSGKNVILKNANLRGASLNGTSFTDQIDLSRVKFGAISLSSNMFESCQLTNAEYDPSTAKIIMKKLTTTELEKYLSSPSPKPNINAYLREKFAFMYPNLDIVADFSEQTIDEKFSGADLSGSNLERALITGKIKDLKLRDCFTHDTIFIDCHLIEVDLRGTSLAEKSHWRNKTFRSATFEGEVELENPKLSVGKDTSKASYAGIFPAHNTPFEAATLEMDDSAVLSITGNKALFDPCYSSEHADIERKYTKFTKQDILEYCAFARAYTGANVPTFNEFKKLAPEQIPDFSELDLQNIDFSRSKFDNCNFSYARFNGSNFQESIMKGCNFSGASFSGGYLSKTRLEVDGYKKLLDWQVESRPLIRFLGLSKETSMQSAVFEGCDFTWADLSYVKANNAKFNGAIGINLYAQGLQMVGAEARDANFSGAYLRRVRAPALKAKGVNLSNTDSREANFKEADLEIANFAEADCERANFEASKLNATNFFNSKLRLTNLKYASMKKARIAADITGAEINCSMQDADCSSTRHDFTQPPKIEAMSIPLADSNANNYELMQARNEMANSKRELYNKYAFAIIGATALFTLAIPLIVATAAPTLISTVALQAIISTSTITISALIGDLAMEKFLGFSPGANKMIANLFGADTVSRLQTQQSLTEMRQISAERDSINNQRNNLSRTEQRIMQEAKKRYERSNKTKAPTMLQKLGLTKKPKSRVAALEERSTNSRNQERT